MATRLELATVRFLAGDRYGALDLLAVSDYYPPGRSPLLVDYRYEHFLVKARADMRSGMWQAAVDDSHTAMALEPDRIVSSDDRDLYLALSSLEVQRTTLDPGNVRAKYLAGKYLVLAGESQEALVWLQEAVTEGGRGKLSAKDIALAWDYLARARSARGDLLGAQIAFEQAIAHDPQLRTAYIGLLEILQALVRPTGVPALEQRLAQLGPMYLLSQYAPGEKPRAEATKPEEWQLVGYDIDEQLLEQATSLSIVLWWRASSEALPTDGLLRIGNYWLQHQTIRNIFPNAGFEWGTTSQGIPLGQDREYYGAPAGSLTVLQSTRNGLPTHVLRAQNSSEVQYVALVSSPIVIDANASYLMSGWLLDQDRQAKIGRLCVDQLYGPDHAYYIGPPPSARPTSIWVHAVDVAPMVPGHLPIRCATFLSNVNSRGIALWDNVLLARLEMP